MDLLVLSVMLDHIVMGPLPKDWRGFDHAFVESLKGIIVLGFVCLLPCDLPCAL